MPSPAQCRDNTIDVHSFVRPCDEMRNIVVGRGKEKRHVVLPYPETHIQEQQIALWRRNVAETAYSCSHGVRLRLRRTCYGTKERVVRTRWANLHQRSGHHDQHFLRQQTAFRRRVDVRRELCPTRARAEGSLSVSLEVPFVFNVDEDLHLHTNPVSAEL